MRFQIPLYKMFLILAAYAAAFAAFARLEAAGIAAGAVIGTGIGGLILAVRTKKDLLSVAITAVGSIIGGFLAALFFAAGPIRMRPYDYADFARDCIVLSIGAALGGLFFSWASKR